MIRVLSRGALAVAAAAAALLWNGEVRVASDGFVSAAQAWIGRPLTPMSYAGVARRSTVRYATPGYGYGGVGGPASGVGVLPGAGAGAPGVGVGGVGGPASGVGVLPGLGAGQAGVGYSGGVGVNLGGPVNRVGVR